MVAKRLVGVVVALAVGVQALHPFTLRSPAFVDGGTLPASSEYRGGFGCHGLNRAPLLTWSGVPAGTRSFALAVLDPDAAPFIPGGWVHWVVYNIPADAHTLNAATVERSTQGTTSFGTRGYGGPCPPANGEPHHYVFTLYALGVARLSGHALTRDALLHAMAGHILGATSIVGKFRRP